MIKLRSVPRSATRVALAGLLATLIAGACSTNSTGGGTTGSRGHTLTAAQVKSAGSVTLTWIDFENASGEGTALTSLFTQFEQQFPNITIKHEEKGFVDYGDTIGLLMSSSQAPDIAEANVVMARKLIPAKLLYDLTPYYQGYGWTSRYPSSVLGLLKSTNGVTFGSGPYWGQGLGGNMVGVYYNKALLTQLGLRIPSTFADFENDLAVAKAHGVLPIQEGNKDQWPLNHVLSEILPEFTDPQLVRNWVNGVPGSTFASPQITNAMAELQKWADDGYLSRQANGILYNDSAALFGQGQGLFYITGSWEEPIFHQAMSNNVGFFLLPPRQAGATPAATGWMASPFTIASKSAHPDIAAFLLDFMSSPAGTATAEAAGYLPFQKTQPGSDQTENDVVAGWEAELKADALISYLDFATPSMNNTLFPVLQELIGDQITPAEAVRRCQANWTEFYG